MMGECASLSAIGLLSLIVVGSIIMVLVVMAAASVITPAAPLKLKTEELERDVKIWRQIEALDIQMKVIRNNVKEIREELGSVVKRNTKPRK